MAFRFAGDLLRAFSGGEDEQEGLRLENPSLEEREWEADDDETLRELERNQQSIRTAIERLKAKRIRTKRF
jgi:hypothetical protein